MFRLGSSSIRSQLVVGTALMQSVLVVGFISLLVWRESSIIRTRSIQRIEFQSGLLAAAAAKPLAQHDLRALQQLLTIERTSPSVSEAQVIDLDGRSILADDASTIGKEVLDAKELDAFRRSPRGVFLTNGVYNGYAPIMVEGKPAAIAWVWPNTGSDDAQIRVLLRTAALYGLFAILANAWIATLLANSVTRPLSSLLGSSRRLAEDPSAVQDFPLPVTAENEAGELTEAFNGMVRSLENQRAGLADTLSLLDSMLANAPIGFAFYDRGLRYVRVNQFLADINSLHISRHLGRRVGEVLPAETSDQLELLLEEVFRTGTSIRDLEFSGPVAGQGGTHKTWLASFFPVRSGDQVRWVGSIVAEITERKQTEEALRKSEKLAAAGRLAASIAHEINNPLEGVTNLLYLLRQHPSLDAEALEYAKMAQHEVARVSEVTQQTLRFYRQSTLPVLANIPEVLNSILSLHQGRIHTSHVEVVRKYGDVTLDLFAFSGEMRQLFANLVGNALDAMPQGGRLVLRARRSVDWSTGVEGIRICCADTGIGMSEAVRSRIFEAFFTTKEATGTGLGLWVSAEIIEKHGGRVRIKSRPESHGRECGTVFMLFFPNNGLESALAAETAGHVAASKAMAKSKSAEIPLNV